LLINRTLTVIRPTKSDEDKSTSAPANSYVVATVDEIETPKEEGILPCFIIETLGQLDDHLTSDLFVFDSQSHPLEEVYAMESYYMTMKDSLSLGDNYNDNETGRLNNLVKQNLLPVGITTVEFYKTNRLGDH
jgi:hypothetical protein